MKWKKGGPYGTRKVEVVDEDGQPIAEVWTQRPDGMDNLNLIINAPELVDVLEALLGNPSDHWCDAVLTGDGHMLTPKQIAENQARAVLSKVKGTDHDQ